MIPRIRGSAVQKENGKWSFFVIVAELGSDDGEEFNFNFDFETKDQAIAEMKKVARIMVEEYEKAVIGSVSGKYIDMKTNSTRNWDGSDEH